MFIVHASMYLLKYVPAQSHCSKHVKVFFDNLSTVYEEYSSPKSVWQKHFKHHIRLFLPALYILKVIFLLLNQTLHITAHTHSHWFAMPLWQTLSTDPYMVTMTNNYSLLNSIQQTPHHWTSLYFYSTMEYLHTVKLYWKKRIPENNALPECCALTA